MKKTLLAVAALGLVVTGCIKTEPGPSEAEKMVTGKWRLTYAKGFSLIDGKVDMTVDVLAAAPPCVLDDLTDLRADHSYYLDQGNDMCFPFLPKEVRRGTWALRNNDKELIFTLDSNAGVTRNQILSLTPSRMELYTDTTYTQDGYTISGKTISVYEK